jgi:hypothetical protein
MEKCPSPGELLPDLGRIAKSAGRIAVPLLFLFATVALGAVNEPPVDPGDDFSPMLFCFALFGLCIVLVLIGVGIVIAAIVAASAAILVALGIVSTSALVGLLRRRFSSGLRAFHYQVCAVAALPAGVAALWFGLQLFRYPVSPWAVLAVGSVAGAGGGLVLAFAFDYAVRLAYRRFVTPSADVHALTGTARIARQP